jgi:hypothetical protein
VKSLAIALATATAAAAVLFAPPAQAEMPWGNYEVFTPRDPIHVWIWQVACDSAGCPHIVAIPRPGGGAVPWDAPAQLVDGRYVMHVDPLSGLICPGYATTTHDTWSWDANTLEGTVDVSYDQGCWGAPAGTDTYPFRLQRY